MDLAEQFRHGLAALALPPSRALVGVSGGGDSLVLLDLLVRTRDTHRLDLTVAHVDHGIHPDSGRVAAAVAGRAAQLELPVEIGRLALGPSASETRAREERYRWLEGTRRRLGIDWIVLGHHADDQVETVLLRVLEGSGPAGLAAMAPVTGRLVRPLLPFRREQLAAYARERNLHGWDDPANSDPKHLRAWCRAEVLPMLRRRRPDVDRALLHLAAQAREQREAWDALLDRLPELAIRAEPDGISIAAPPLDGYDSPLGPALIQALGRRVGCTIGSGRSARLLALVRGGRSGTWVPLGGGWRGELAFGRLHLVRGDSAADAPAALEGEQGVLDWGAWRLTWRREVSPGAQRREGLSAWFVGEALSVRAWRPGDRIRPIGGRGGRPVVRCFHEARVPRHRRAGWPTITAADGSVLWVPGVCRSDGSVPDEGTEALRVDAALA